MHEKIMTILQDQIKKKIADKNLSVRSLELKAGLGIGTVQKILSGERIRPGSTTLSAISHALGCSVDSLLNGSDDQTSISKSHQHPWDSNLYLQSQKSVDDYLVKQNITLPAEKVIKIVWEVYTFALSRTPPSVDVLFVDWLFTHH